MGVTGAPRGFRVIQVLYLADEPFECLDCGKRAAKRVPPHKDGHSSYGHQCDNPGDMLELAQPAIGHDAAWSVLRIRLHPAARRGPGRIHLAYAQTEAMALHGPVLCEEPMPRGGWDRASRGWTPRLQLACRRCVAKAAKRASGGSDEAMLGEAVPGPHG